MDSWELLINARKRNRMAAKVSAYGSASEQLILRVCSCITSGGDGFRVRRRAGLPVVMLDADAINTVSSEM